jgi:hypothetical protein
LIPANLLLFGSLCLTTIEVARHRVGLSIFVFVLLGLTTFAANKEFAATRYRELSPGGTISHVRSWQALVMMARQCRVAHLPVPNVPMGTLTQEFWDWDLKQYQPLLRHSLGLSMEEKIDFEPWGKLTGVERQQYEAAAPALLEVRQELHLPQ